MPSALPPRWSPRERVELALIPAVTLAVWAFREHFPLACSVGSFCLFLAGVLLVQSLVRDLWIWLRLRFTPEAECAPQVIRQCMCVESLVGVAGVLVGLLLLVAGGGSFFIIKTPGWLWTGLTFPVLAAGFLIKDLVIDWSSRRILRERDHSNWLPRFR